MFQPRPSAFDHRVSAIAGHLRAIEKELGDLGKSAGRRTSASASVAGNQIAEAVAPILNEIVNRFSRGRRWTADEAASFGNEAMKSGARIGNNVLDQLATQTKQRPLVILAVAVGVGILIGAASRRK
jgi:hypothetical protein